MIEPAGDAAPIDVVVQTVIRRPPEVVSAYASDPSNAPTWYANISEVVWTTTPPVQVGSQVAFVARFLGRTLRYTYEVVEHTRTSLVMRTAEGPFPMETSYRYESTPDGHTRMTLRNRGHSKRLLRAPEPVHAPGDARRQPQGPQGPEAASRELTSSRVDALLDAAEAEFAAAGIEAGSLRKIMRAAGADPGAVHYHFGGREALAEGVLTRILVPLNARRRALLDRAVASGAPTLTALVEALVRPDIETAHEFRARSPGRARLIGTVYLRPADFVEAAVSAHFAPVAEAFRPHLQATLRHVPFPTIAWRVRWCVFGTLGALLTHGSAPYERDADGLVAELVRTLSAALAA